MIWCNMSNHDAGFQGKFQGVRENSAQHCAQMDEIRFSTGIARRTASHRATFLLCRLKTLLAHSIFAWNQDNAELRTPNGKTSRRQTYASSKTGKPSAASEPEFEFELKRLKCLKCLNEISWDQPPKPVFWVSKTFANFPSFSPRRWKCQSPETRPMEFLEWDQLCSNGMAG